MWFSASERKTKCGAGLFTRASTPSPRPEYLRHCEITWCKHMTDCKTLQILKNRFLKHSIPTRPYRYDLIYFAMIHLGQKLYRYRFLSVRIESHRLASIRIGTDANQCECESVAKVSIHQKVYRIVLISFCRNQFFENPVFQELEKHTHKITLDTGLPQ